MLWAPKYEQYRRDVHPDDLFLHISNGCYMIRLSKMESCKKTKKKTAAV